MGIPMIALAVGAAAVQGVSAYEQGQAASKASAYNAKIAANNAQIATQNAQYAGAEGEANTAAAELKNRAQVGAIKTAQAANGVDVNSGSAVNVRSSQAELGELNALNIRANAARQAYGYETQSMSATAQQQLDTSASQNENTESYLAGAGSFLGSASSAANFAKYSSQNNIQP